MGGFEHGDDDTPSESFDIGPEDLDDEPIQLPDNGDLMKMISESDSQLLEETFKTRLFFKNHSGLISLRHKWGFRVFAPTTNKDLKGFEACVMKILPRRRKINHKTLSKILSSKSYLGKLKGCITRSLNSSRSHL